MKKRQIRQAGLLLLTAAIWGFAFAAQSVGMEYVGPFTFNCVRFFIGGLVLIPCIVLLDRWNCGKGHSDEGKKSRIGKMEWAGGICCGVVLASASCLQQIGLQYTTVGKTGFLTACYILLVPLLGLFFHKRCEWPVWIGVILGVIGLYFLCMDESLILGKGDVLVFCCSILFAIHILVIDYFAPKADGVRMSCIQFLVSGVICLVPTVLLEQPQAGQILAAWQSILYAGVLSCGVAYTLQIIGQKGMNPTVASLILSLESVISVLAGLLVLQQVPTKRELLGCGLMFAAIMLAQIPVKGSEQSSKEQNYPPQAE